MGAVKWERLTVTETSHTCRVLLRCDTDDNMLDYTQCVQDRCMRQFCLIELGVNK